MTRLRKLGRLLRNVWLLRRELAERYGLLRRKPVKVAELRCLHCGRELTRPCRPARRAHMIRVPEGFGTATFPDGSIMYVARTKPGQRARDVRSAPF